MKVLIALMTFTLLASCSSFQRLRSNLNDQVVIGKEEAPARMPASVGLPYQLDSKNHKSVDNEFQNECARSGGDFKYSGCSCNNVFYNPFVTTCSK
jgi:hypothetical protein